jgi:1,4-alpha-glucan branching enzyme
MYDIRGSNVVSLRGGEEMVKKTRLKKGSNYRVTFTLPEGTEAERVAVLGDFNDWDEGATLLTRRKAGHYSASLTLKSGREYRFRYLLDGMRWRNDEEADGFVANPYGTQDSLLRL